MPTRYPFRDQIRIRPESLIAFAWSAPMRELAKRVGMSDVGLRKLLVGHGVVLPPQGHWNRVHAGRKPAEPPKPAARKPGQRQQIYLDARFASVFESEAIADPSGPFFSSLVPESLDDLRSQLISKVGKVSRSPKLEPAHPGLAGIIKHESDLREKAATSRYGWSSNKPRFDNPLDQRRLRILNGLFWALRKQGVEASAYVHDLTICANAKVGDTTVPIELEPRNSKSRSNRWGNHAPSQSLPASTPLRLSIGPTWIDDAFREWTDTSEHRLEHILAEIVVEIIVHGESDYRQSLQDEIDRIEEEREAEREQRRQQQARLNAERLAALKLSGELLRQAQDIRSLIASVKAAVVAGTHSLGAGELASWEQWANSVANELDPVISGQVWDHLIEPELEDI